jgi:hypothetical protein
VPSRAETKRAKPKINDINSLSWQLFNHIQVK